MAWASGRDSQSEQQYFDSLTLGACYVNGHTLQPNNATCSTASPLAEFMFPNYRFHGKDLAMCPLLLQLGDRQTHRNCLHFDVQRTVDEVTGCHWGASCQ